MECRSVAEIRHCLETLPEKLDDHYHQAWKRATCNGNLHKRKQAYYTLMWIILAEQPLSLRALNEAVVISMSIDARLEESATTSVTDLLFLGAGIVAIESLPEAWRSSGKMQAPDPSGAKVLVVHASASEYFYTRQDIYFPSSCGTITKICAHAIQRLAVEPLWESFPLSSQLAKA
jgi:hypothetical protein